MRILLVSIFFLMIFGALRADDLHGQDDPRFESALALWLDDDEATALPELAALAAGGNRAAQVLLAQIDLMPWLQGPWVAGLPRADRIALLRAPGGQSGRSWMRVAAEDTPLAQLWLVSATPDATAETVLAFAAMGEHRAARITLVALSRREYRGFAAMADEANYPPDMRSLIWQEWAADPAGRARAEAEIAALHPGDPQPTHFDFRPIDPDAFDDWLANASLAAPLRAPCAALCPDSVRSCTRAAFQLLSSYSGSDVVTSGHGGLLVTLGSPLETLIAPDIWNASPRGLASILRQPETRFPDAEAVLARVAATDACFAAAAVKEAARFPK
jgi:hypothetical protein